ncbi:terminase small subunit [Lacticaseibacillus yichunensis]|uniref:Terminase small subunit n=1 Tax=Lacticaseibacillus yichunensis TaxID=2486015 RepID=A0ABW4CJX8_9LACO|nr:terminase small subunit [Lacticaseibacillus yichunensis]
MARKRDPARELARDLWLKSDKRAKLKDIAAQLGKKASQIRKWKSEDKWEDVQTKGNVPKQKERSLSRAPDVSEPKNAAEERYRLFAFYYLQRFNATWAYMKVYRTSYDSAMASASKLLRIDKVQQYITEYREQNEQRLQVTASDLLNELVKQAKSDISDYLDWATEEHLKYKENEDGEMETVTDPETGKPQTYWFNRIKFKEATGVDTSLIKSVSLDKGEIKLELYDKQKAIKELLDRLPEPVGDDGDNDDGFLKAIDKSAEDAWKDDEDGKKN